MKNWKFYIVIGVLAIGLSWCLIKFVQKSNEVEEYKAKKDQETRKIQTEAKEIARAVDEKGIETVLYDITKNVASTKQVSNAGTKGIIDTVAMALNIRNKQLKEIMIINSTLTSDNLKLRRQLDQNRRPFYTYSGNGLDLKFTPPLNDLDSTDMGTADFRANVKLTATQYWRRSWFLGSKKSILAIKSDNPYFKINNADFVEFEQKQPVFGLRLQAATNYNPQSGSLGFGPAARIDIGRLSFQGNYTWYPESSRWRPSINANYDIVRF